MPIEQDIQSYDVGQRVELFLMDLTPLGMINNPLGTPFYRWSPSLNVAAGGDILWGGNQFIAADIQAEGFEWSAEAAFPTPTLRVSNVVSAFSILNAAFNDLVGAEVTRIITFEAYLDTGAEANPGDPDYLMFDTYRINRKVLQNRYVCEYELISHMDQQGRQVPGRQFMKDICHHTYRRWNPNRNEFSYEGVTCPYGGTELFTEKGEPTESGADDVCSKHFTTGCEPRFSFGNNEFRNGYPFGGFPAMSDIPE